MRYNLNLIYLGGCLQANPEHRLTISAVLERVAAIAESNGYNLRAPLIFQQKSDVESNHLDGNYSNGVRQTPPRPAPPQELPKPPQVRDCLINNCIRMQNLCAKDRCKEV